jgi:hypothetical protein
MSFMPYRAALRAQLPLGNLLSRSLSTVIPHSSTWISPKVHLSRVQYCTRLLPKYSHSVAKPIAYSVDTIYALSTAEGRAGIAIVRVSGPSCLAVRFLPNSIHLVRHRPDQNRFTKHCVHPNQYPDLDMPP